MKEIWQRLRANLLTLLILGFSFAYAVLAWDIYRLRMAQISQPSAFFNSLAFLFLLALAGLSLLLVVAALRQGLFIRWLENWGGISRFLLILLCWLGYGAMSFFLERAEPRSSNTIGLLMFQNWLLISNCLLTAAALIAPSRSAQTLREMALSIMLVLVLPFFMLEIGLRFYFSVLGREEDKIAYIYSAEYIDEYIARFEASPFLNYRHNTEHPEMNSLGYRGVEIAQPKPDGVFRIVAIGSSTTYGQGIEAWQNAYPAQLEQILHRAGYNQVEVINAGVNGYTSWEDLTNFQFRLLDLQPDMIILYEATNDVNARLVSPEYYQGLTEYRGVYRTEPEWLGISVLWRFVAINLGWMQNPSTLDWRFVTTVPIERCSFSADNPCADLDFSADELLDANPPIYYERNMRNLLLLAQGNGVQVLLSSWAYSPEPIYLGELNINYMSQPWRQRGVDEHNVIVRQLAEEFPVLFVDLEAQMPDRVNYWLDGRHLSEAGAALQAQFYADALIAAGVLGD